MLRARTALLVAGTLICVLLAGCSPGSNAPSTAPTPPHNVTLTQAQRQSIHVVTIEPVDYKTSLTATAVVDFDHDRAAQVPAPFSGSVTKLLVKLGDHVKQGQPLAKVHSPDYAAAVGAYRKAVLAARAADTVAANDRDLYAKQAISQRENAQAQADAAGADAERAAALQQLVALHMDAATIAAIRAGKQVADQAGVIRAPIAGRVVERSIAPGQSLVAGTTECFTIADTSKMWVMVRLFGTDADKVHVGDTAKVFPGGGGKPLIGRVAHVGAVVDPATRSVTARVVVDNPDDALKKAMYVEVHIRPHATQSGILVPVSAVLRDEANLPFVYALARDGGYARTHVTLGPRVADRYVVPSGLHTGEQVVVDGGIFLRFIQTQ